MKPFEWNQEKNKHLKETRGVSFEEIVEAYYHDGLIDIIVHPNKTRYPTQKIMLIKLNSYVYMVPFVVGENKYFLKTIFPSSKYTRLLINCKL